MVNIQNGQALKQVCLNSVSLTFLIYINNLPDNSTFNPKLFGDDTWFFSVIDDKHLSVNKLIKVWIE